MPVFRFLAAVFLLVATVALVVDATPWVYGASGFEAQSLHGHWQELAPNSLAAAQKAVTGLAPWLWDDVVGPILDIPTFITFGALALLCGYAGRRRRTIDVFVN
jgi:hypothetical protein